ncbi:iron ABC transporter permease [Glaciecola sp. MH2013]|uniref:FecCD family ABC transporter permease n=1 Tax=Glaciecola sp. MH2013 TaxID=2785524 RepID=UPI00189EBB50|nr:iron ABC transporter permease [Glaciecola sp. MH2013]MBF7073169.1 iron ABC transporter permease [Glaciecola sp. MH2013]
MKQNSYVSTTKPIFIALLLLASVLLVFTSLDGFAWLVDPLEQHIFVHIKLPIMLTAILVGASISLSSAALQVLLRNPLADPGIIGISAGASLMAAIVLLTGALSASVSHFPALSYYLLPIACFIGALISSFLIFALAKKLRASMASVILAGIGISTVSGALIGWLFIYAPPQSIKNLSFWLMGSLHNTNFVSLAFAAPVLIVSAILLLARAKALNWLYLGQGAAQLKGLNPKLFEKQILILAALLVGTSVSIAGSIAFLGLLTPHFVRQIWGHDNRLVLPLSAIIGATILLATGVLNELLFDFVVPISMLTASIGGPLFIYSLLKQRTES